MENSNGRSSMSLKEVSTFQPGAEQNNPDVQIVVNVIYTSLRGTLAALQAAETLACQLHARITLRAAHSVPYGLPITRPPVALEFAEHRLLELAKQRQLHTSVHIYICRDRTQCLMQALCAKSLVVLGVKKKWWPTRETRLARQLQSAGHQIVLVEPETNKGITKTGRWYPH